MDAFSSADSMGISELDNSIVRDFWFCMCQCVRCKQCIKCSMWHLWMTTATTTTTMQPKSIAETIVVQSHYNVSHCRLFDNFLDYILWFFIAYYKNHLRYCKVTSWTSFTAIIIIHRSCRCRCRRNKYQNINNKLTIALAYSETV